VSRAKAIENPKDARLEGRGRAAPQRAAAALLAGLASLCLCFSCVDPSAYSASSKRLEDGADGLSSVAFSLNHRRVKLELYLRLDGGRALVELDHPDGRTIESLEVSGTGIKEIRKEFEKEPGSWGLRVSARGGALSYWAALHDRKDFVGPDEAAKRLVEKD
jgi:hypothetical protein